LYKFISVIVEIIKKVNIILICVFNLLNIKEEKAKENGNSIAKTKEGILKYSNFKVSLSNF
jgi:hypothetical protein